MNAWFRRLLQIGVLGLLVCASGCLGGTQNTSYFPYLWPTGDIIPTHAKPGLGFYKNFDPYAVRLEVRPMPDRTNPVRTQQVIIATVYDKDNQPRRNRRVEFLIEGAGHIIEVDESGFLPGRGYKVNDKYAVTYTSKNENRVTRGSEPTNDDFMIRPGQTWCIVSSPIEGDTHVTVYAPGIYDWQKNQVHTTLRWVDATWEFPAPVRARAGTTATLTTRLFRHTDKRPLEGYRVRYKLLDGPPAVFSNDRPEYEAVSDSQGNATVVLRQPQAANGLNNIAIEIVRPPDPLVPSGAGVPIGSGTTSVEWLAPQIQMTHTGPANALVGSEVAYETTILNNGAVESQAMSVSSNVPDGLQYLPGHPRAIGEPAIEGRTLTWALGVLPSGKAHKVISVYKTLQQGQVSHCASVTTIEGLRQEQCAVTNVGNAALKVNVAGPQGALLGAPVQFVITLTNPGNVQLNNILLQADLSPGLGHASGAQRLRLGPETLAAGESKTMPLDVVARQPGPQTIQVEASSDSLVDRSQATVLVQQPRLGVQVDGPKSLYVGKQGTFTIAVVNDSDAPLANVTVRDRVPPELSFVNADQGGRIEGADVVWSLAGLQAKERRVLQLTLAGQAPTKAATQTAVVAGDGGISAQGSTTTEVYGTPAALRVMMKDDADPVQVGRTVTYRIKIANTGQMPANRIQVQGQVPNQLRVRNAPGAQMQGNLVMYGVPSLQPGQELDFAIECEALQPGDVRFVVTVTADSLDPQAGPIREEEPTRVIPSEGGAGGIPPVPGLNPNPNPPGTPPLPGDVPPPPLPGPFAPPGGV